MSRWNEANEADRLQTCQHISCKLAKIGLLTSVLGHENRYKAPSRILPNENARQEMSQTFQN